MLYFAKFRLLQNGNTMDKQKIGFIGLGLMGGSLSIALRKYSKDSHFIGLDHNAEQCTQALALKLVDEITDSLDTLKTCDIIIISIRIIVHSSSFS